MAFDSFHDWVTQLDRLGELVRISSPVATELELTELADRQMKSPGGGKALLIERPTINGKVSPFPVAINTLGSWRRMALSLGTETVDQAAAELGSLVKAKPPTSIKETLKFLGMAMDLRHARPRMVKTGPCKEVIHMFDVPETGTRVWPAWRTPSPAPGRSLSCSAQTVGSAARGPSEASAP
jgi:4-hydroxy-3-polyprenylbenzoate decarboxylase